MTISFADASTWTTPGANDAASKTYASVQTALSQSGDLAKRDYEVFLQGSYANSTNVPGDSDVDIVAMLLNTFRHDLTALPSDQRAQFDIDYDSASYYASDFRRDTHSALITYYGATRIEDKDKCIRVLKRDGYLDADVVPALQYRKYLLYTGARKSYIEGIILFPKSGGEIINYPKEHRKNGEEKNKVATRYKKTVRQIKQLRNHATRLGLIEEGTAPGYLIECMIYNVANNVFIPDDHARIGKVLHTLDEANLSTFRSCDGIHTLFGTDPGNFSESDAHLLVKLLLATFE